jgi:hypothetical protein
MNNIHDVYLRFALQGQEDIKLLLVVKVQQDSDKDGSLREI